MKMKKSFLLVAFCFISPFFFAQSSKDKNYYIRTYQDSYQSKRNIGLIYSGDREIRDAIEKKYIDINFKYNDGVTLFFQALQDFNYEPEKFIRVADFLVKNGADVNIPDDNGQSPLLYAVKNCYISQKLDTRNVDFLLKNKADVKVIDKDGESIMFHLCKEKKPEMNLIKKFISLGAPVNVPVTYSFTPLTYSLYNKNIGLARLLLESGADANLKDDNDNYPLILACQCGDFSFVKYLISKGAKVRVKNKEGWTPLHYAIWTGSKNKLEMVKFLVEKGSDVNAATSYGNTPFLLAAGQKNGLELMEYLVGKKADVNGKDKGGYSAAMACASGLNLEGLKFLEKNGFDFGDKNNSVLIQAFVESITCNNRDKIFYYSAVMKKEKEIGEIIDFLAKKIDVNARDSSANTALHTACGSIMDYTKIVEALIKNGADINAVNDYGWTPIFYCSETPKIAQLLVDSGADLSVKDKKGKTALDWCEEGLATNPKNGPVVEILKANSKVTKEYSFVQFCQYNYGDKALEMLKKGTAKGIDDYDSNGFTPLYYAVISKNLQLTKALLDKGCDINKIQRKDRTSVLYHAVDNVDVEMVKLLLKYKPDLSIKYKMKNSYSEDSILGVGLYAGNIYQKKESAEVLKCLLEAGCDPNAIVESEDSNLTLTVLACLTCEESKIELLVEYGGNPFVTWKDSRFNTVYSIIRKDYKGTSISYERQNAVYGGLVKQFKGKRFVAEENLRLRDSPGLYGSTVTAIKKGSKVEILNADKMEVIDDIDSCWVQVKIQAGTSDSKGEKLPEGLKGWCFLGYLKEE